MFSVEFAIDESPSAFSVHFDNLNSELSRRKQEANWVNLTDSFEIVDVVTRAMRGEENAIETVVLVKVVVKSAEKAVEKDGVNLQEKIEALVKP